MLNVEAKFHPVVVQFIYEYIHLDLIDFYNFYKFELNLN